MANLAEIVDALGSDVVRVLHDAGDLGDPVSAVVIHDPHEPGPLAAGTLLLGIAQQPGAALLALMARAADDGSRLALKLAPDEQEAVGRDAQRLGVTVVLVDTSAAWAQVVSLLRSIIDDAAGHGDDERLGGVAAGDLFALANAVAALIDAPVTIEDPHSRVIAYSAGQERADEARMATILGRQIPQAFADRFRAQGVYRRLSRETGPIYLDDIAPAVMPRLAVAVRAGDEMLGSIWAAVPALPSVEKVDAFGDAARIVAVHLLRHRVAADLRRGLHADLVALMLAGGQPAASAAARLGLEGAAFRVLAAGIRDSDAVDAQALVLRLGDALAVHLAFVERHAVSAVLQDTAYAVLPVPGPPAAGLRMARQAADGLLDRLAEPVRRHAVVAIGAQADGLAGLPAARQGADHVLRLLRRGVVSRPIGDVEGMATQVLLARLADLAGDEPLAAGGPLDALTEHDTRHHTEYVATLRAYLESFGDVPAAARTLAVHQNTFRYRLQRLHDTPGLDLGDPDQRLALLLQLRLRDLRAAPAGTARTHR